MVHLPSYITIWGKDRQGATGGVRKEASFTQGMSVAHRTHDTEGMEGHFGCQQQGCSVGETPATTPITLGCCRSEVVLQAGHVQARISAQAHTHSLCLQFAGRPQEAQSPKLILWHERELPKVRGPNHAISKQKHPAGQWERSTHQVFLLEPSPQGPGTAP